MLRLVTYFCLKNSSVLSETVGKLRLLSHNSTAGPLSNTMYTHTHTHTHTQAWAKVGLQLFIWRKTRRYDYYNNFINSQECHQGRQL